MANNIVNGYELIPGADLPGIELAGSSFRGDLHGANLSGANLFSSIFNGVNLQDANLQDADLEDAYFRRANLRGANLRGANFRNADLTGADLTGADLWGADLTGAKLIGANLTGANLTGASLRSARLDGADLTGARLDGAILNGAIFQDAILNGRNLEIVQAARPRPPPAPIEGRAYEIHNAWNALNIDDITRFLQEFNTSNATVNEKTIPTSAAASSEQSLFTPLLNFIDNSELFRPNEKEANKQKLIRILSVAQGYEGFNPNRDLLNLVIAFISKQSDDFIEQYIIIISDECLNAYGRDNVSCVKGAFERIVITLGAVAITLTKDESMNQENETYKTLKKLFREINFAELVQEWSATYLEDGEKEEELKSLSTDERKAHFINFMRTKYGILITPIITAKILEEAEQYQQMGVFERMSIGGRRGKRKTRKARKTRKTMKIRKTRKTRRRKTRRRK